MNSITNIVEFGKGLWEFKLNYKKRLPLVWYQICESFDEKTIKTAMIMLYKEFDKFNPYNTKDVKNLLFYCKMLKNFKVYEVTE